MASKKKKEVATFPTVAYGYMDFFSTTLTTNLAAVPAGKVAVYELVATTNVIHKLEDNEENN